MKPLWARVMAAATAGVVAMHANADQGDVKTLDAPTASASGLHLLQGGRLRLLTDVAPNPDIQELLTAFDAALPQWAAFFGVEPTRADAWRVEAFLIADRQRFASLKLTPVDRPLFTNGFALAHAIWLEEQPSPYYRRHLMLHEGTHAFMLAHLGSCGPQWLMEGTAELLGTHRWQDNKLTLRVVPNHRDEAPMWGRIKLLRDAREAARVRSIPEILAFEGQRGVEVEQYAWAWALAFLLDQHPRYAQAFHRFCRDPRRAETPDALQKELGDAWPDLLVEWQAYTTLLDYGYDVKKMAMTHRPAKSVDNSAPPLDINADRGWQSTGWRLNEGTTYQLHAAGLIQVANDPRPWMSEANGITLEYFDGKPLGQLLGAIRPAESPAERAPTSPPRIAPRNKVAESEKKNSHVPEMPTFASPLALGVDKTLTPERSGTLYVRVNDSPARLGDNQGAFQLTIRPLTP